MRTRTARSLLAVLVLLVPVLFLGSVPASADPQRALIEGDGSTWSQNMLDQWRAIETSAGLQVSYSGGGSSYGRKSFANSQDDFAITEIPYQGTDENNQPDASPNRPYAYLPIVAGGTAFSYHVEVGGKLMKDVRLSGETITKIFTTKIVNWNDPQISSDNNGRTFPDLPITPVVRSDGSGTTAQFTTWMNATQPALWQAWFGRAGLTSTYPMNNPKQDKNRIIAAPGSDQVMNTIAAGSGNGTIGYVEYSYALNAGYPVVKVLNAAGFFTEPKDTNVAVALTKAVIKDDLTQVLDGVYANPDPRTYPLSSYSYMILPTGVSGQAKGQDQRMTTAKRQTLADFLGYALCAGQEQAGPYGYSPLPLNLVQAAFTQVAKLQVADKDVVLPKADLSECNNPTFVAGDLSRNHLAEIAPQPEACDQTGAGPCLQTGQVINAGGGKPAAAAAGGAAAAAGGPKAGGPAAGPAATAGLTATADPGAVDPETGEVLTDDGSGDFSATGATSTTIAARPASGGVAFGVLAALELAAIILIPGLLLVRARRQAGAS